jgi:hypothetical protein
MYLKYFHISPVLVRDIGFSILSGTLPTDSSSPIPAAGSLFAADSSSFVHMPTVVGVISVQYSKISNSFVSPN